MSAPSSAAAKCTICLDGFTCEAGIACSHTFCMDCIKEWSRNTNLCPVCKKEFEEIRLLNPADAHELPARNKTRQATVVKVKPRVQAADYDEEELERLEMFDVEREERELETLRAERYSRRDGFVVSDDEASAGPFDPTTIRIFQRTAVDDMSDDAEASADFEEEDSSADDDDSSSDNDDDDEAKSEESESSSSSEISTSPPANRKRTRSSTAAGDSSPPAVVIDDDDDDDCDLFIVKKLRNGRQILVRA